MMVGSQSKPLRDLAQDIGDPCVIPVFRLLVIDYSQVHFFAIYLWSRDRIAVCSQSYRFIPRDSMFQFSIQVFCDRRYWLWPLIPRSRSLLLFRYNNKTWRKGKQIQICDFNAGRVPRLLNFVGTRLSHGSLDDLTSALLISDFRSTYVTTSVKLSIIYLTKNTKVNRPLPPQQIENQHEFNHYNTDTIQYPPK